MNVEDLKAGDKVVLHSCEDAAKEKYRGIVWTVEEVSPKHLGKNNVKLKNYGLKDAEYLQIVYPEKEFISTPYRIQDIACTKEQAEITRKKFQQLGITTIETIVNTWWGGKDCVKFTFKGQNKDYRLMVDFLSEIT